MSLIRASVVLGSILVVSACSQAPVPSTQITSQAVMAGAAQWNDVADQLAVDVIECLNGRVIDAGPPKSVVYEPSCKKYATKLKGKAIHLDRRGGGSPFDRNFREFLTTNLVKRGLTVSNDVNAPLTLYYRVYMVPRNGERVPLNSIPGKYTAAAGGLGALSLLENAELVFWESALLFGGAGILADAFSAGGSMGGEQIVLTVSLMKGDDYVMRRAAPYFIHELDLAHYANTGPVAEIGPRTRKGAKAPMSRTFNVVAE